MQCIGYSFLCMECDKYLVALQRLRVVDLIGQDVVGCAGFKRLARRVRHSRKLWQVH